jgi:hypothetical protein
MARPNLTLPHLECGKGAAKRSGKKKAEFERVMKVVFAPLGAGR